MSANTITTFEQKHGPVAFRIGFIEADVDAVLDAFVAWKRTLVDSVEVQAVTGGLAAKIASLEPLTMPPRRSLFVQTQTRWTAYFDNSILGTDAVGPVIHLVDILKCRGVIISSVSQTLQNDLRNGNGAYGATQFELYDPATENALRCLRSVHVSFDSDKWRFDASGEVQPFEEVDSYKNRSVSERFTREMLVRYALSLGINAFVEEFYCNRASLVSHMNAATKPARECSLVEAQLKYGLRQQN